MPVAAFESFNREKPGWAAYFDSPLAVYQTNSLQDVIPVLKQAEEATRKQQWAVVLISYEASPVFDPAIKVHPPGNFPLVWVATFDRVESPPQEPGPSKKHFEPLGWNPIISRQAYTAAIARIRNYISQGDTYQVNYTFPLSAKFQGDSWEWYRRLGANQGAGYSAYLDLGPFQVLSFSPELFFKRQGNRLQTRPMKGTLARGRWLEEDESQIQQLKSSAKNRAENIMIVDLLRNDLGKISDLGSVCVTELCQVESYETLLQMTSTIESTIPATVTLLELMSALFPCGSVTGAPKIRTMEIIRELEPDPRFIYTGTMGFVCPGGDCVFNVAIRTLWLEKETGETRMGVGGGITIDSSPEDEYAECLLKSQFLNRQQPEFELLETLLLECGQYFLLSNHLIRMQKSARYFGFAWKESLVMNELNRIRMDHPEGNWKVRLLSARDTKIRTEISPLPSSAPSPLVVALAPLPVDSRDPFLFNKTTHREIYEAQLATRPDCDDLIFWNERGEACESSIANIVLETAGLKWTPPRRSGLLAGTFRDELIQQGKIQERVIPKAELVEVGNFFLINSVRKWIPAQLVI